VLGGLVTLAAIVFAAGSVEAGRPSRPGAPVRGRVATPERVATLDVDRRIDVNNLNMFVVNNGAFGYDLAGNYNGGLFYPNHTAKTAVYAAGLWVGAKVGGETRLAVAEYDQEYRPGRMLGGGLTDPPGDPRLIVYKVVRYRGSASDTAHVDNPDASFDRGEDPLGHHSWSEYLNGAKPFGAPTRMWRLPNTSTPAAGDSVDVEGPDVLGDMMLWCVYNDADPDAHTNEAASTAPLGIQVEQTTFAFDRLGSLGNTIFVKYKFSNRGTNVLDSVFVSQWADADLGQFTDDLVGCDTLPDLNGHPRSMGFVYNGTNRDDVYGDIPPALGIDFLQGPVVPPGDTLGLASFAKYINGTDPLAAGETYHYMTGINGNGTPIVDPFGNTTRFMVAGDLSGLPSRNWVDTNPADRRFFMSSGPFRMLPGDSQTVIVAIMVGQCGDRLSSIKALKFNDDVAQEAYDLGFAIERIPPAPPTPVVSAQSDHGIVRLSWGDVAASASLPPGYSFEGYNVYQGATIAGPWKLVAVYDSANGVREVFDKKLDETNCEILLSAVVAHGADNGIRDFHVTTEDRINGTSLKDATDYYFAVTSYAVNVSAPANRVLESPLKAVPVTVQRPTSAVSSAMIRAVPNPYYAHSAYEQTQFNRRIRFTNCPAQCTIRIFNLAGQLIRTLDKNDAGTSVLEWDIQTQQGLPVGSGVYVYHIEAPGSAAVRGRLVVFMEKERLNNF
jgi:hypothetical protein